MRIKEDFLAENKERVDILISKKLKLSRAEVNRLIKAGFIFVEGKLIRKAGLIVREGMQIRIDAKSKAEFEDKKLVAKEINFRVIFEDRGFALIEKPTGLVVHPGSGREKETLVHGLLWKFKSLSNLDPERPGIVHRLDKDTSGLLLIAKDNQTHQYLVNQIKRRLIKRYYLAIVVGRLKADLININLPIGRDSRNRQKMVVGGLKKRDAFTRVEKLAEFYLEEEMLSLVRCQLDSGRTHQIRTHLSYIGNPIFGDPLYGRGVDKLGQRLHSYKIEFKDPKTQQNKTFISYPEKEKFSKFWDKIQAAIIDKQTS